MQWITVVLAVIVTTLFCSNQVKSTEILDINKILRTLQGNIQLSEDDAGSRNHHHYGSLVKLRENIIKLNPKKGSKPQSELTKEQDYLDMDYYFDRGSKKNRRKEEIYALNNKEKRLLSKIEKKKNELLDQIDGISSRYSDKREKMRVVDKSSAEDRNNNALLQLLDESYHPKQKTRLSPNNLLFSSGNENNDIHDNLDVLDGYSKLYVILNPQALKNPKNLKGVAQLLPKIRSVNTLSLLNHQDMRRHQARRVAKGDDKDDDQEYRPRRPRSDYGYPGGRTPIPYMNHRGDIYERDD